METTMAKTCYANILKHNRTDARQSRYPEKYVATTIISMFHWHDTRDGRRQSRNCERDRSGGGDCVVDAAPAARTN